MSRGAFAWLAAVLAMLVTGLSGCAFAGSERALDYTAGPVKMQYLVSLPDGLGKRESWPLLVFLHGSGERGSDLTKVRAHGPPKLATSLQALGEFIVVSPQCPAGGRWDPVSLRGLVAEVVDRFPVDEERMYLTGLSLGGYGTWEMGAKYPGLFAALVPVCGGGSVSWAGRLADTPVWAFHGALDSAVPLARSQEMIDAIETAGGRQAKLTVYPKVGHPAWERAYANPRLYAWLLKQRKGSE